MLRPLRTEGGGIQKTTAMLGFKRSLDAKATGEDNHKARLAGSKTPHAQSKDRDARLGKKTKVWK